MDLISAYLLLNNPLAFFHYPKGKKWVEGEDKLYFLVLTNNPAVATKHRNLKLVLVVGDVTAVYKRARDLVHKGHRLLTHPLSSSLKPGRIPYKTVVLTAKADQTVDLDSLSYMAAALEAVGKSRAKPGFELPAFVLDDYAAVDLSVFESALDSLLTCTMEPGY